MAHHLYGSRVGVFRGPGMPLTPYQDDYCTLEIRNGGLVAAQLVGVARGHVHLVPVVARREVGVAC